MRINPNEILETIQMIGSQHFDIRTVTQGISLLDCSADSFEETARRCREKVLRLASRLVSTVESVEMQYGIPIVNKRIAVTPISIVTGSCRTGDPISVALALDEAAAEVGVNFLGGYSALVHKGFTNSDRRFIGTIPQALAATKRVCSSVNVASTKSGINMDAVASMGEIIKDAASLTSESGGLGCAKLVVFANAPDDNPFMAGAFHGIGEAEAVINVGVSGPGVVRAVVESMPDADLGEVAEAIKRTAFKITRMGELVGRKVCERLDIPFGIVDLSLAPTPAIGDSVANILEAMGLERCGTHGTTAALALLNDAVKKGGSMASSYVGGLSGAFIPVSEDQGMIEAVQVGALGLSKLEAMTAVCSVGIDMVAVPGDTPAETISALIADEMAIGVINNKTTAVRVIPVPGAAVGALVEFGGLLGTAPVMEVSSFSPSKFIRRGGRIPAPLQALTN